MKLPMPQLKSVLALHLSSTEPKLPKSVNRKIGVSGGVGVLEDHQARLHESTAVKLWDF